MEEQEKVILLISSRLLSYPNDSFVTEKEELEHIIHENIDSEEIRNRLTQAIHSLHALSLQQLQETYVATFDLKEKAGLYLTAHELGDSRKRGAALIKLQKLVHNAGLERVGSELVDYIPMLFELRAVADENDDLLRLTDRLAFATQRIKDHIGEDNPYFPLFDVLMAFVFTAPSKQEIEKMESEREEADLEPLPYPIMYQ